MKKVITGNLVKFTFDVEGGVELAPIVFDAAKASAENRAYAEMHGWQARLGDAAALSRKQKDGTVITVTEAMRRAEIESLITHYESGATTWKLASTPVELNPAIAAKAAEWGCTYVEAQTRMVNEWMAKLGNGDTLE